MAKRFYCRVSAIVFFIALLHVLLPIYILLHFSQTVLMQTRNSHRFDNSPVNMEKMCLYNFILQVKNMRFESLSVKKKVMRPRGHSVIAVICVMSSHNPSDFPRYYKIIKRHQHALVVNKKSIMNHTLAVVFLCVLKKVEVGEIERIRASVLCFIAMSG